MVTTPRWNKSLKRNAVLVTALVVALALIGLANRNGRNLSSATGIGKQIAEFSLPKLRFPDQFLASSEVVGEVTLINVWATWCVPCRQEHGMLLEIARSGEVPIYGLNYKDNRDDAIRWLNQLGDPYVSTGFDDAGRVGALLGVFGVPETYILHPDGSIAYRHVGIITDEGWEKSLLPLVRKLRQTQG